MSFSNPVVGGTTLVRNAIQSADYAAGSTGWAIFRTGAAEFNNVTVRGTFEAGGGVVRLNAGGLHIGITPNPFQYDINVSAGFLARLLIDDGSKFQMEPFALFWSPASPTPKAHTVDAGFIDTFTTNPSGTIERVATRIASPAVNGQDKSYILLEGETSDSSSIAKITIGYTTFADIHINGYIEDGDLQDIRGHKFFVGENSTFLASFGPVTSVTFAVTFAHAFSATPNVYVNIISGAGRTAGWQARAISISTTGFTYFLFQPNGVAGTWVNDQVSWTAQEYT